MNTKVSEHVGVLRAFAGEKEGQLSLPRQRLVVKIDSIGILNALAISCAEELAGMQQLLSEVGE